MMPMGFVERFPADFGGLKNGQRLAFRPCENFQGPNGTDANSSANIGKQRQYQGSETNTEQTLVPRSRHRSYWELPFHHPVIARISPGFRQWSEERSQASRSHFETLFAETL